LATSPDKINLMRGNQHYHVFQGQLAHNVLNTSEISSGQPAPRTGCRLRRCIRARSLAAGRFDPGIDDFVPGQKGPDLNRMEQTSAGRNQQQQW